MLDTKQSGFQSLPATHVRFLMVALVTATSFVLYVDRFCLTLAERYIREDLNLSNRQIGWLLSAFFWAYALGQVPAGWLSDRYGARFTLFCYIQLWSVFTGFIGLASSFFGVLLLRGLCGLAQAGAYPTSASILSRWVPFSERGLSSSIVALGGRIGGAAAPILTAYLLLAFVPVDDNPPLKPTDLIDLAKLARELQPGDERPGGQLAAVLREHLSVGTLAFIDQRGTRHRPFESTHPDVQGLLADLNNVLIRRELYTEVDVSRFALEPEALRLAKLQGNELRPAQVLRRNRLLLEAAYPDCIRKIYGNGWRPGLIVFGVFGILVGSAFWIWFRERPQDHPRCNAAEIARIETGLPQQAAVPGGRAGSLPLRQIVNNRSLWMSSLTQIGTNFGWVFLVTWLPRYLSEVHQVPVVERGWMASIPVAVGMLGMFSGGWLTDRFAHRFGLYWGRVLPLAGSRFLAMTAFAICVFLEAPWPTILVLAIVALFTDLGTPALWAYAQDVGGPYVGTVLGWGNMWGNLGAAISPPVLDWIIEHWGWPAAFWSCSGAFLLAGIASFGVDARMPIDPAAANSRTGYHR